MVVSVQLHTTAAARALVELRGRKERESHRGGDGRGANQRRVEEVENARSAAVTLVIETER